MPTVFPDDSVGLVSQTLHFNEPLELTSGKSLAEYDLVIETYGELNATQSNAVLICHALSGHHHAAGYHSVDEAQAGLVGQLHRSGQADRHPQVLRRRPQQPRRLQRIQRPRQHQSGDRQGLRRGLPDGYGGRLGA